MATPVIAHDDSARGAGLHTVLEIVRRRRLLALLPFAFVLAAAASLAFFLPSLWTARATVLVNRQEIPEAFVKSTVNSDVDARLLTLSQDVLDTPRLSKIIQDNGLYPSLRRTKPMPDVVERMRKDIAIDVKDPPERRGRESTSLVFTVAYTATDPVVSARVTNTLASLFSEENRRQREQQAVGTSEFLEAQLKELRTKLAGQEQRITAYKEQHLGELPEQKEVNLRTLERLQQQLSLAYENNRRATERRQNISQSMNNLDLASAMAGSPGAALVGPTVTPAESAAARLSILRQELAALQTTYSDKYPDVIQMKEQIRLTERRAAEEEKKLAAAQAGAASGKAHAPQMSRSSRDMQLAVQNPYVLSLMQQRDQADVEAKASADEIKSLTGQIALYQRRLEMTPKRDQELALITRDYETTRDMFRQLLAKRGEADIAAELEQRQKGEKFRVIEQARLPERPAGPNRMRLLIVGLVLALGAAGVAVVLAEQVDTSYRRAEEVRATAGVPVLSTIPRIVTEDDRLHAARQRRMALAAVAVGLLAVVGTSFMVAHNNQSLVTLMTPDATATVKR
jgi:polysaccharide chain length determinant protein (PEP-CTERM system associated)